VPWHAHRKMTNIAPAQNRHSPQRADRCREPKSRRYTAVMTLGSGLVDHSQKMTVAARAMAEKKTVGQRS
jgi:hypothetical protein